MLDKIIKALTTIDYPDKETVWRNIVKLGHKHERRFAGYKFIPRGGLSSPYVAYVTDVDFIFNTPKHGQVSLSDFDALDQLARELCVTPSGLISAKVAWEDEDVFDEEITDMREVRRHVANGADVVIITGRYALASGWHVSMDFALQRGAKKMSKKRRIERIWDNVQEGNYAKIVSRIRSLLTPDGKASFAGEWNEVGGALRFLVKQLELVRFMSHREQADYMSCLCLPTTSPPEAWAEAASAEMQRRALDLLLWSQRLLAPSLGAEAEGIFAALGAAANGLTAEPQPSASPSGDVLGNGRQGGTSKGTGEESKGKAKGRRMGYDNHMPSREGAVKSKGGGCFVCGGGHFARDCPEGGSKGKGGVKRNGICVDFRGNGSCRFGDNCRFSHDV